MAICCRVRFALPRSVFDASPCGIQAMISCSPIGNNRQMQAERTVQGHERPRGTSQSYLLFVFSLQYLTDNVRFIVD